MKFNFIDIDFGINIFSIKHVFNQIFILFDDIFGSFKVAY